MESMIIIDEKRIIKTSEMVKILFLKPFSIVTPQYFIQIDNHR